MSAASPPLPAPWSPRWLVRRAITAAAILAACVLAWYFEVMLPERTVTLALAAKRAANAQVIPDLQLDLVWIEPGNFDLGTPEPSLFPRWYNLEKEKFTGRQNPEDNPFSPNSRLDERPVTRVLLRLPFWMGRTEVTQSQYAALMGDNPSHFKGPDRPVEQVSWAEAMVFCQKLTERERAAGRLQRGYNYTLPTEAQWEYAGRAGTTGEFASDPPTTAWMKDNSGGETHPVATKQPNAWGLFDLQGNVREWCRDWFADYPGGRAKNPTGPATGAFRVLRGSCYDDPADDCRPARRMPGAPTLSSDEVGFRVALSAGP